MPTVDTVERVEMSGPEPKGTGAIPASVLVGFLGAGKTTLLNHLLTADHGRRIAVVVNDFSDVSVDAKLVRHASERLVEMANGCICCTLRDDLIEELAALAAMPGIDQIIVESTGIGEPMPIAQAFHTGALRDVVRLDSIVTVVDGAHFWADYARSDLIEDAEGNPVTSPLAPLLVDQLEYTNVILLNKTDGADADELLRLEGFVRSLNPWAVVHRTERGVIDPAAILDTGLYRYEDGPEAEGWEETWGVESDAGEADEYGFTTFTYVQPHPLDHGRFMALFDEWPNEVMRAKGFVVFTDRPPEILSLVHRSLEIQRLLPPPGEEDGDDAAIVRYVYGHPHDHDPDHDHAHAEEIGPEALADAIDESETELVFIGRGIDVAELIARLDACAVAPDGGPGDGRDNGPESVKASSSV